VSVLETLFGVSVLGYRGQLVEIEAVAQARQQARPTANRGSFDDRPDEFWSREPSR
jgi:hypothetical protein